MIKAIRNLKEKQLLKERDALKQMMENYPDGKITDLVGANAIYDQMNRIVNLAGSLGYSSEEIMEMFDACKCTSALSTAGKSSSLNTQF